MGTSTKEHSSWNSNALKIFCKWLNWKHIIACGSRHWWELEVACGRASSFSFLHQHWHFHISVHRKRDAGAETQDGSQELYTSYSFVVCVYICWISLGLYFLIPDYLDLSFIPKSVSKPIPRLNRREAWSNMSDLSEPTVKGTRRLLE